MTTRNPGNNEYFQIRRGERSRSKAPERQNKQKNGKLSPSMNTGMNAPDGTGMVVATADIQNCKTAKRGELDAPEESN